MEPFPVIIYLIDTARADRFGAYGHNGGLTPNFDAVAAESVLFEDAYAPAPWTLPSVTSLFLSKFVTEHGIVEVQHNLPVDAQPLGRRLAAWKYRCAGYFANAFVTKVVSDEWGFEIAETVPKQFAIAQVDNWLEQVKDRNNWLLYLHTTEPHNPYMADLRWIRKFGEVPSDSLQRVNDAMQVYRRLTKADFNSGKARGTTDNTTQQIAAMATLQSISDELDVIYNAHIALADKLLGETIESLKQQGVWDRCMFIVLSDHGEEFGEHEGWQHDQSLYDELLRVPLIVKMPGKASAGRRVKVPVTLVDITPTILDCLGASPAELAQLRGSSLRPLIEDDGAVAEGFAGPRIVAARINETKYFKPTAESRGDWNIAVREGPWKGIWNITPDGFELYNLENDPHERHNLADSENERAARLKQFVRSWMRDQVRGRTNIGVLSDEMREKLEGIGYIYSSDDAGQDAP